MNLPSIPQCFALIREMEMMGHIIDHSVMVSNVAVCLGRLLKPSYPELNIHLLKSASLLHDITKTRSFKTGEIHSKTGGDLLRQKGFPEVGEIIRQHVILDRSGSLGPVSEPEIVNYADKRVLHDQVVPLPERLAYIRIKYGTIPGFREKIEVMWEETLALEEKLFQSLDFLPEDLPEKIRFEVVRGEDQSTT